MGQLSISLYKECISLPQYCGVNVACYSTIVIYKRCEIPCEIFHVTYLFGREMSFKCPPSVAAHYLMMESIMLLMFARLASYVTKEKNIYLVDIDRVWLITGHLLASDFSDWGPMVVAFLSILHWAQYSWRYITQGRTLFLMCLVVDYRMGDTKSYLGVLQLLK